MKITILKPAAYCAGVTSAIEIARKAKSEHPCEDVYVIGMLVHNDDVIANLHKEGITTLFKEGKSYLELLKEVPNKSVVVFSAHGHDIKMDELAKKKDLIVYDAVCSRVKRNLNTIKAELTKGNLVIYVGQANHPETIGAISLSNDVILYNDKLLNNNQITTNRSIFVINQTTLNYRELLATFDKIKKAFPNANIEGEVCSAARLRQQSIVDIKDDVDMILVVGSKKSSNTNKLIEIAKQSHPEILSLMVEGLDELKQIDLRSKKHVVISSGASTPLETINVISQYLDTKYNG